MKLKADYDQLEEEATIKERKETEVRISRQLQQYLQPKPLPDYKGLGIDVQQIPGNGIGSDLCDYLLKDDKLVFCIGSALEQEILTSLAAETARATFRAVAAFETDPGKMATAINKALTGQEALKAGVALFIGTLDLKTGKLAYCSAGHHAPLLLKDEVGTLATDECKPLGVDADYSYTTQETELANGSMLFCFTDGLTAAENGDGKVFGAKMVRGAALQALKLNPQPRPFIQSIKEAIAKFTAATPQKSDITMLVVAR
jgi:serine phosphatase RsbU (regulator of sigma subunit)